MSLGYDESSSLSSRLLLESLIRTRIVGLSPV